MPSIRGARQGYGEGRGTPTRLAGRVSAVSRISIENDGGIRSDRNEYAKAVAIKFKAADVDDNGAVDARELDTKEGSQLLKLVQ